ncbi:uncharacterized protein [Haliotis asinina]|uniref:uncharacterized protein isoform X2 n=1 Tax=Haliotis asinina TaxID=109174 RepID=UPI003531CE4D
MNIPQTMGRISSASAVERECYTAIGRRSLTSRRDVKRLKCVECCHGNLCNRGGCSTGPGKSNACYDCRFTKDPQRCQHETICLGNEHCFIEKVLTQSYDIKYIQGCIENAECETLRQFGPIVGKRDTVLSTLCASCCYGDKCNGVCSPQGFTSATLGPSSTTSIHSTYRTLSTPITEDTTAIQTTNSELHTTHLVTKDTNIIGTKYGMSKSPLVTEDTTVIDTQHSDTSTSPLVTKDAAVIDTTYRMSPTSPVMTETTTTVDSTHSESYTSHSMTIDTTAVETSGMPDTSHSMNKDTTTIDTTVTHGAQSSDLPKSTGTAFSTMGHAVTAPPSTRTTTSLSASIASAVTRTVCHKECAGSVECRNTDVQVCRSPTPYCFTVLDKHASGSYNVSKRCADRNTCNDKWLKETSGDNRCVFFNPAIKDTFTCFYCCTTYKCNMQSFPPYMSSLFRKTDRL